MSQIKTLTLQRINKGKDCTLGILLDEFKKPFLCTLEDPWLDNKPEVSCIPKGRYLCLHHNGLRWQNVPILANVLNRSNVLIHAGNSADDTLGCILVGEFFKEMGGKTLLLNNSYRSGLDRLRAYIGSTDGKLNSFNLIIEEINI